ncbi:MAG: hypothetical protein ACMXYA_02895, partial [Candidatus Woesearchaeota archaeon]
QESLEQLQAELEKREKALLSKEQKHDVLTLKTTLTQVRSQKDELESQIEELEQELTDLQNESEKKDDKIQKLQDRLAEEKDEVMQVEEFQEKISELEKQNAELQNEVQKALSAKKDQTLIEALSALDELLEHVPKNILQSFVKQKEFHAVEQTFEKYGVGK